MFEKEAEEWVKTKGTDAMTCLKENIGWDDVCEQAFKDGAEFGYNKGKEELIERLDNAKEIIEMMKDLFFDCWQERGLKAIQFEQRVNDFLKGA